MPERNHSEGDSGDADSYSDPQVADSPADPKVAGAPSAVADAEFALLLTHDVDRPYKTIQSVYHAIEHRDFGQLAALRPGVNPWWQFGDILQLEESLGVRSAFYFLREQHLLERPPSDWFDPFYWVEHFGRYGLETPEMLDLLDRLREGGWEIGLHGSYDSYDDAERLRMEKKTIESALGESVTGGRQHHLNRGPETWNHHREIGLQYDATPGSSETFGFDHGYQPARPFDDEFVVFPLTVMECALPDPGEEFEVAWQKCEALLAEAAENDAVMSALWHPRLFNQTDFPGYQRLYRRLIEAALEMGAWVGPPGDYYAMMDHPGERASESGKRASDSGEKVSEFGSSSDAVDSESAADRSCLRPEQVEDNKVKTGRNTEPTG